MADLISRVSKISTGAKLWVVGLVLTFALIWSVDSGTGPGRQVAQPEPQSRPSVSQTTTTAPPTPVPQAKSASSPTPLATRQQQNRRPAPPGSSSPSKAIIGSAEVAKARSKTDLEEERPSAEDPALPRGSAPPSGLLRLDKQTASTIPLPPPAPRIITETVPPSPSTLATPASERPRSVPSGYFTVGSSKDEVLAAQGMPTRFSESQWGYGLPDVRFQSGRVTSWYVSPVNSLKVRMLPESESDANAARARGHFTVGSTKDEVLAVQGTPTRFSESQWSYGLSDVRFQSGRVTSWYVSPVNSLKAVAPPRQ